jgi:hypothetical protein
MFHYAYLVFRLNKWSDDKRRKAGNTQPKTVIGKKEYNRLPF